METLTATSLNVIRSWEFDFLTVVPFSKDGNILKAVEIDAETAKSLSSVNSLQNGWVITTTRDFLNHAKAKNITKDIQNIIDGQ